MTPLEISTAAMSANSGSLIIICAVASAVILIVSFLHERLKAFNAKHSIITYSDTLVRPVSWNGGRDGVDAEGVTTKPRLTHVRWGFSLFLYHRCTTNFFCRVSWDCV